MITLNFLGSHIAAAVWQIYPMGRRSMTKDQIIFDQKLSISISKVFFRRVRHQSLKDSKTET